MNIYEFKEYVKEHKPLSSDEIHQFMHDMNDEARRITIELNTTYRSQDEIRKILSRLFGYQVPSTLRVFPPFYTDFGKNIKVGENVFINACCHFQDHGGGKYHRGRYSCKDHQTHIALRWLLRSDDYILENLIEELRETQYHQK